MIKVILVIRELNKHKPASYLSFDVPELPRVGDYVSIFRGEGAVGSEDVVVRHVWWHLRHSNDGSGVGNVRDIMVECDAAIGPYATETWRGTTDAAKAEGAYIAQFRVSRNVFSE